MTAPHRRVRVDPNLCEGHALCIDLAPDVFELADDEVATCAEQPPEEQWEQVLAAVDACPRQAISVITEVSTESPERTAQP